MASRLIIPRRNVPQINTEMVAGQYFTALNSVVSDTNELVRQFIIPQLEQLFSLRDLTRDELFTSDGILEDLNRTIQETKRKIVDRTLQRAASMALAVTLETSAVQRNQQEAQLEAMGRPVFAESPFTADVLSGARISNERLIVSLPTNELERIGALALRNLESGETLSNTKKQINKEFQIARNRAELISSTQVSQLTGNLGRTRNRANAVELFVWRTRGDSKVRPKHAALNGRVFSFKKGSPTSGLPGSEPNCRCTAESFIPAS